MGHVVKLDDPAVFDAIPTGLKTTSGIKAYELAKYNSLFNQFKSLDMFGLTQKDKGQLSWVADNWLEIIKYVVQSMHHLLSAVTSRPSRT